MRTDFIALQFGKIFLADGFVVAMACLLPAMAHVFRFPVYFLDPMRLGVFAGLLLVGSRSNTYALAVAIPFLSWALTGHPVGYKAFLISFELMANIFIFYGLTTRLCWPVATALFVGILGSKMLYYAAKYCFLQMTLLSGNLISTPLWIQLASAVLLTAILTIPLQKQTKNAA